jgi:hypothetical protein
MRKGLTIVWVTFLMVCNSPVSDSLTEIVKSTSERTTKAKVNNPWPPVDSFLLSFEDECAEPFGI